MPDPIRSVTPDTDLSTSYSPTEELSCTAPEAVPNQSLASETPAECTNASGASGLVNKFGQKDYSAVIANASTPPAPTPGMSFGTTSRVHDGQSTTLQASFMTAQDSYSNARELSVSLQGGAQNALQAELIHIAAHGEPLGSNLSGSLDLLTAKANLGKQNDDGSTGGNIGAMVTIGGVEVTAEHSGWSGTLGWSASVGIAVSSGTRDIDHDGKPETCFKAAIGPATVGICTEF